MAFTQRRIKRKKRQGERVMRTKIRADERWSEMYKSEREKERQIKCLKASITLPLSVMQKTQE